MKLIHYARATGALALLALAIPASAAAVPGVYTVDAKLDTGSVTFATNPVAPPLDPQTQYVVSNDGYSVGFAETNGVTGGGVLNYKVLPTAYRAPATADEKRTYTDAQTDVQAHATCSGVADLTDGANILAWQSASSDPAYNYIPWQKTTAGLGDDPAKWIPVVKTATGVDLSKLATVADFTTACEGLGGAYHAADAASAIAGSLIANALAPVQKQVTTLQAQVATLTKAKAASDKASATDKAARKLAEDGYQALFARPLIVTLVAKRFAPGAGVALVTGSVTDPVTTTIELTKKQARKLGLPRELALTDKVIGDQGAVLVKLKPDSDVLKKIKKVGHPIAVKVHAVSGGLQDSVKATIVP
jgi:hypothetical protein